MNTTPDNAPVQVSDQTSHESSVQHVASEEVPPGETRGGPITRLVKLPGAIRSTYDVLDKARSSPNMDGSRIRDLFEMLTKKPLSPRRAVERNGLNVSIKRTLTAVSRRHEMSWYMRR